MESGAILAAFNQDGPESFDTDQTRNRLPTSDSQPDPITELSRAPFSRFF
jgi:hypothetical protein